MASSSSGAIAAAAPRGVFADRARPASPPLSPAASSASESDEEESDAREAALDAQLTADLLAMRHLRDEEVGIAPEEYDEWTATAAAAADAVAEGELTLAQQQDYSDAEDEEFKQLLSYKPRCTFRPKCQSLTGPSRAAAM